MIDRKSKNQAILTVLLALLMAIGAESSIAYAETSADASANEVTPNSAEVATVASVNDFEFELVGDGTYRIKKYNGTESAVTLPQVYQGAVVSQVGEKAFEFNGNLASITIPEGYVRLGRGAFSMCRNLTSATLPNSLGSMEENVFGFTGLSSITIPANITAIPDFAFNGSKLASIVIPNNVTSIGQSAFFNCLSLSSVTLSSNLKSIGNSAFAGRSTTALKGLIVPSSVTSIGATPFINSPVSLFVESNSQLDGVSLANINRPIFAGDEATLLALRNKQPAIAAHSAIVLKSLDIQGLPAGDVTAGSEIQLTAVAKDTVSPDGELQGNQSVKWKISADPKVATIDENTGVLKINSIGTLLFDITAESQYGADVVFDPNNGEFIDNSGGNPTTVSKSVTIVAKEVPIKPEPVDPKPSPVDPKPLPTEAPSSATLAATGDNLDLVLWASLLFASGSALTAACVVKRNRKSRMQK